MVVVLGGLEIVAGCTMLRPSRRRAGAGKALVVVIVVQLMFIDANAWWGIVMIAVYMAILSG